MESGTVKLFETLDTVMRVSVFRIPDARCVVVVLVIYIGSVVRMNLPETMGTVITHSR